MRFLIIFDSFCFENGSSVHGVVSEFTHGCCFKVSMVSSQFVVSINLIQCILVSEEFVLGEIEIISLGIKFVCLFCRKVLTPTSRVIPVMVLQNILRFLIYYESRLVGVVVVNKLLQIAALVATLQLAHLEVCLSHLLFFFDDIEQSLWVRV